METTGVVITQSSSQKGRFSSSPLSGVVWVGAGAATTAAGIEGVLDGRGVTVETGDPFMLTVIPPEGIAGTCTVFEMQRTCWRKLLEYEYHKVIQVSTLRIDDSIFFFLAPY